MFLCCRDPRSSVLIREKDRLIIILFILIFFFFLQKQAGPQISKIQELGESIRMILTNYKLKQIIIKLK